MKLKYLFLSMLAFVSCTDDIEVEQQDNQSESVKSITVVARDFISSDQTRTNAEMTPDGAAKFTWSENDTIGIFPNQGQQVYFSMAKGVGTNTAIFDGGGWALKSSSKYSAYYPMQGKFYLDQTSIPVSYEGQTQIGNASTAHVGKYDYMAAMAGSPKEGNVHFNFQHLGCLLELSLTLPDKGNFKQLNLSSEDSVFTTKGFIDLTSDNIKICSSKKSDKLNLNLEQLTEVGSTSFKTYLMMAPDSLEGQNIRVSVISNGRVYANNVKFHNLEAGKVYKYNVVLEKEYSYYVDTPGTLSTLINQEDLNNIKKLKISGFLNGTDIKFIKDFSYNHYLDLLDIYDAKIVSGGASYGVHEETDDYGDVIATKNLYTSNDVIGEEMFSDFGKRVCIHEYILPKTTKVIAKSAFSNNDAVRRIVIPNTVKRIENGAFEYCYNLTSANLPDSVEYIGDNVYIRTKITDVFNIPKSLKSIGAHAFEYKNVKKFTITPNLTYVGENPFSHSGLEEIIVEGYNSKYSGDGNTIIDRTTQTLITGCNNSKIIPGVLKIGDYAFYGCDKLTNISVPSSVKEIGCNAFDCSGLQNVTLNEGLEQINSHAFANCKITDIVIPKSVNHIGQSAIQGIYNIKIKANVTSFYIDNMLSGAYGTIYLPASLRSVFYGNGCINLSAAEVFCFAPEPPSISTGESSISFSINKLYVPYGCAYKYRVSPYWQKIKNIYEMPENAVM